MLIKYLMNIFSGFKSEGENPLANAVRVELSKLILRILLGLVLAATLVFCIFRIFDSLHVAIGSYLNPTAIELASFSVIGLGALYALYRLFNLKLKAAEPSLDIEKLMSLFAQGFLKGFTERNEGKK